MTPLGTNPIVRPSNLARAHRMGTNAIHRTTIESFTVEVGAATEISRSYDRRTG